MSQARDALTFRQSAEAVAEAMTKMVSESERKFSSIDLSIHLASLAGFLTTQSLKDDGERAAFVIDLIEELLKMSKVDAKSCLMVLKEVYGGSANAH